MLGRRTERPRASGRGQSGRRHGADRAKGPVTKALTDTVGIPGVILSTEESMAGVGGLEREEGHS